MRLVELLENILIKEMAKRAMTDIVDERRDAQKFFDVVCRGNILRRFLQKGVEMPSESAGDMHRPQRMHKTAVLCGRVDPARALQLKNVTEPLHPRRINQILFSGFRRTGCF